MAQLQQQFTIDFSEVMMAMDEDDPIESAQAMNYNNGKMVFIAMFCFKLFGIIFYISDLGSDIGNGYWYLHVQKQWPRLLDNSDYNYTRALCDDWQSYRHTKMGASTMLIVWLPSAVIVLFLGTVYIGRNFSLDFRIRHDRVRAALGMTDENSNIVRLTNWVECGTPQSRTLKGVVLILVLCLIFCTWPLISVFILMSELYYFYTLSDYRFKEKARIAKERRITKESSTRPKKLFRNESEIKIELNKRFAESFSIMIRTVEISTESILQLILQLYIAIYNDFKPGPIQIFSMSTSFVSLVLGTFYWNSDFRWDRKYRDGLKAIPLYVLSIIYKCLSITTMIAVMSHYSALPIILLWIVLAVIYYRLISDATPITKLLNIGSIYLSMITMNVLYQRRDLFKADDKRYLEWFSYEAGISATLHSIIMVTIAILWKDHDLLRSNLNDCAITSLQYKLPYICLGIACMGILHFILTLIYVGYFPHVWRLDPRRRCQRRPSINIFESKGVSLGMMSIVQTMFVPILDRQEKPNGT